MKKTDSPFIQMLQNHYPYPHHLPTRPVCHSMRALTRAPPLRPYLLSYPSPGEEMILRLYLWGEESLKSILAISHNFTKQTLMGFLPF
jgi:hypothetical protein